MGYNYPGWMDPTFDELIFAYEVPCFSSPGLF